MDRRRKNNMSAAQRRVAAAAGRKKPKPSAAMKSRLDAAKTVLRRHYSEVYDAGIDDPRFKGMVRIGARKYSASEALKMAADILAKEATRQRELRSQYNLPPEKGNR
jgi:hypothetical protein